MASVEAYKLRAQLSTRSRWYPAAPHVQTVRLLRDWIIILLCLVSLSAVFADLSTWLHPHMVIFPIWESSVRGGLWKAAEVLSALWWGATLLVWVMRLFRWKWIDDSISLKDCEKGTQPRPDYSLNQGWITIRPLQNPPDQWV